MNPCRRDKAPGTLQRAGHCAAEDIRRGGIEPQQGHRHGQVDQLGAMPAKGKLQNHVGTQSCPHTDHRGQCTQQSEHNTYPDEDQRGSRESDFPGHVCTQPEHRQGHPYPKGNQRQPGSGNRFGLGYGPAIVPIGNHVFCTVHARLYTGNACSPTKKQEANRLLELF
ncbi:hypothetical protein D3C86_831470 [compost metagenome]